MNRLDRVARRIQRQIVHRAAIRDLHTLAFKPAQQRQNHGIMLIILGMNDALQILMTNDEGESLEIAPALQRAVISLKSQTAVEAEPHAALEE